jgi:O-methyltransferase domain
VETRAKELYSADTAPELIFGLLRARVLSTAICTVAEIGVADHLQDQPVPVSELARLTSCNEDSLYRLLRCLAIAGVIDEAEPRSFAQTSISEVLSSNSPNSVRDLAIMDGQEWFTRLIDELAYSVRTGAAVFDRVYGMHIFEYFKQNPECAKTFNAGMQAATAQLEMPVVDRYDFSWADTIADIGGGTGAFLEAVLLRNPRARGILGELADVAEAARSYLDSSECSDRCEVVAVDMFDEIPVRADACILKRVIHDWPDEDAVKILENCRNVIGSEGKVLVIEPVIAGLTSALMDVVLLPADGRERTRDDYERIFSAAGLRVARIVSVTGFVSVVEGTIG